LKKPYDELVAAARRVSQQSYSPYSHFRVGAALLGHSGRIYTGTNVENASLGLSICAERAAVCQAVAAGEREFEAIAIYADAAQATAPCGACRQVLHEFAPDLTLVIVGQGGSAEQHHLTDLLRRPFSSFRTQPTQE
jgi:cytidine deaminase